MLVLTLSLSLGKRPTEVQNPKPFSFLLLPPSHEHLEGFLSNRHSIESRFATGPSSILFGGVYVCTFQPGNFTGWGSEEVKHLKEMLVPLLLGNVVVYCAFSIH